MSVPLVLMFRRVGAVPSLPLFLTVIGIGVVTVAIVRGIVVVLGKRIDGRGELKPFLARLSRCAPGEACPCGRSVGADRPTYQSCCRSRDVATFEQSVRAHLIQYWSHRSFAGRRWSRPMKDRINEFPVPKEAPLPEWVTNPERFTFPIDEETVRGWTPETALGLAPIVGDSDDALPI